jgi:ABC-2 type transport system ATP-binding protein
MRPSPSPQWAPYRLQPSVGHARRVGTCRPRPSRREGVAIEPAVAVRMAGVTKRYNGHDAVANLDLEIPTGAVVGVIGPSGSGKTTTVRMITGSLAPTTGTVEVLGDSAGRLSHRIRERIGYLPQQFSMYPDLTVQENVDFAATLYGLVLFRRFRRRRAVLELVDLWSVRGRRAGRLSGGMQRRLELAAALVHEPDLLVLDEPTAGLDPLLRRVVWDEVHRLRERGVASIVTTQYVTEAEECSHVALISEGRLIAFGSPADLRRGALGGEVLEVTTAHVFDAATIAATQGVLRVLQTGPRNFRLVVEDAATAAADVVPAIAAAGGEVEAVGEARPTFDEVFTELVERHRERLAAAADTPAEGQEHAPTSAEPPAAPTTAPRAAA